MAKNAEAELKVKVKTENKEELKKLKDELEKLNAETKKMTLQNQIAEAPLKKLEQQQKANKIAADKLAESQSGVRDTLSKLGGFIDGVIGGMARFGAAMVAGATAIGALVVKSEKFEMVKNSFERFVESQGLNADKFLAKMEEMTQGTMSQMDMMLATNKAAMLGLPLEKFPEMMKIAKSAAQSTGESMQFMVDSMVLALGRQSRLILDNLGIIVDVEDANKKYALSLGKTAESLTDAEKKQAFMNVAIEKGLNNAKIAGDQNVTLATTWEQIKAKTENLAVSLGQTFKPVMKTVMELTVEFIDSLSSFAKSDFVNASITKLAKTFNFLGGLIDQVTVQAMKMGAALKLAWGYITFDDAAIAEAKADLKGLADLSGQLTKERLDKNEALEHDYNKRRVENLMKNGGQLMAADLAIADEINAEKLKKEKSLEKLKKEVADEKRKQAKDDELKNQDAINKEKEKKYKEYLERQKKADLEAMQRAAPQPTIEMSEASGGMAPIQPFQPLENMTEGPSLPTAGEIASAATKARIDQIAGDSGTAAAKSFFDGMVQGGEGGARKFLSGMSAGIAEAFVPGLGQAVGPLVDMLSQPPEQLKKSMEEFFAAIPHLIDNIVENIPMIMVSLAEHADEIIIALVKAVPRIITAFTKAQPEVAKALIKAIGEQMSQGGATIGNEVGRWGEQLQGLGDNIGNSLQSAGSSLSNFFKDLGDGLSESLKDLSKTFEKTLKDMSNQVVEIIRKIPDALKETWKAIEDFPNQVVELFGNTIYDLGEEIKKLPQAMVEGMIEFSRETINILNQTFSKIGDFAGSISEELKKLPSLITESLSTLGKQTADIVLNALTEISGGIGELFKNIGNILKGIDFGDMAKKLGEGLKDAITGAMKLITEPINAIIRALNGIKIGPLGWSISAGRLGHWSGDLIPEVDLIPGNIPEMSFNKGGIIPTIQHFASGGTVDSVPAMLTPGEFVVNNAATSRNRDTLEAMNSGRSVGGGVTININVQGGLLGDAQQARQFAKAIDRELLSLRRDNESVSFDSGAF